MERYHIKLTIYGMEGAFADKYSFTVRDAHLLNRYFEEVGGEGTEAITLLEKNDYQLGYDPMALFPVFMKHLKFVAARRAKRRFFTGARFVPTAGDPGPWLDIVESEDEQGALRVEAFGSAAKLARDDDELAQDISKEEAPIQVKGGIIETRWAQYQELFKEPIMGLITIAEEALAKNETLVATTLPAEAEVEQGDFLLPD